MTLNALRKAFKAGEVSKPEYIERAYTDFHRVLFEYVDLLGLTDIRDLSISAHGVIATVRSSGVKIHCQLGDHRSPPIETFNFADFEPAESGMMHKLFEGCASFYDIGANIGWHTLNVCARYRQATFYCFEPIPETYGHLEANIRLNAFANIQTFNLALSNTNGPKTFYFYEACSGNASAANLSERPDVQTLSCEQRRLDDFLSQQTLLAPGFIKCDVEGAELLVFEGAQETLKAHRPIVMAEILRKWSAKYQYNPNQIFDLFAALGYRAFTTDGYTLKPFERMTDETVETNFFFLHPDVHAEKIRRFTAA